MADKPFSPWPETGAPPVITADEAELKKRVPGYAKNVREMLLRSLDRLGGEEFLIALALNNPKAFASLVAKCIPQAVEVTGEDGAPIAIYFPPL